MKGLLFFGAFALLAFVSCKDIDVPYVPEDTPEETYDEAWYADNATISSSDTHFAVTEEGSGTISFKAEGGSVVVYVDCGTEWTADDSAAGVFGCEVQSASITVTADQNLVEKELYGTITLMTAESKIQFATISITQNAYGAPEITVTANEWHVPAVAATAEELTIEIGVEANEEWSIESDAEWLTAENGESGVILTATENETFEERVAEVVLTCTDGYNSDSETVTVTQDARAYITLSAEEFEFDKKGGETEVIVESNYEWSYAYESDWFSISESTDGSLTITVDVNRTGDDREGAVVFTAGDGAANVAETTLNITQSIEDPDALILEYTIPSENTTIQLPIADVTNAEIDWGDDSDAETVTSDWPSHIYTYAGTYTVSISGTVGGLNGASRDPRYNSVHSDIDYMAAEDPSVEGAKYLTAVKQWGDLGLTSMEWAFYNCLSLTSLPDGPGPFENVTNFSGAFSACTSLKGIPEDIFSDCKMATTFEACFNYCIELIDVPENIFSNCTAATTFMSCFSSCSKLASAPTFEGLSKVTSFRETFYNCESLKELPAGLFKNCGEVTTFEYCFEYCSALVSAPSFEGLSKVTSFYEMFRYCSSLATLPENMFSGCIAAEDFGFLFCGCSSLTSVPDNIFLGCSAADDLSAIFYDCTSLIIVPVGLFDSCRSAKSFNYTFRNCSKLEGESPYTEIDVAGTPVKVHLYERADYPDYFTAPTGYDRCFRDCTKLDDYADIPSGWK